MRTQRLARWTGSVLSQQTPGGSHAARVQSLSACSRRLQSSTAEAVEIQEDKIGDQPASSTIPITKAAFASQKRYDILRKLPSPPTSAALSSAKLAALHARLHLPKRLPLQTLAKCLIHASADPDPRFNNSSLSLLGHDLLGYYASELILCTYPRLPMDVTYAAMKAYIGPEAGLAIAREWGVEAAGSPGGEVDPGYLQFLKKLPGNADLSNDGTLRKDVDAKRAEKTWAGFPMNVNRASVSDSYFGRDGPSAIEVAEQPELADEAKLARLDKLRVPLDEASLTFVRALFGALYLHAGRDAAKEFFNQHIRSRKLDVSRMLYFKQPTRDLGRLCAREGFERPVGRILSETGRYSRNPVFTIGVFSGREKLGEGSGGSLDEARVRAAISALKGWYLYSPLEVRVPSDAEGRKDKAWEPVLIDGGEVIV